MKRMLILLCVIMMCGCSNGKSIPQTNLRDVEKEQLEIITDFIRIRKAPSVQSDALGKVYKGEIYTILSSLDDGLSQSWYEIETSTGIRGFIISELDENIYVKLLQEKHDFVQTNQRDVTKKQLEIMTDYIRIRTSPSTESQAVGQVYKGEIYTILSATEPSSWDNIIWYEIETSTGIKGFIVSGYYNDEYVKTLSDDKNNVVSDSDVGRKGNQNSANNASMPPTNINTNNQQPASVPAPIKVTGISLSKNELTLEVGKTFAIIANVDPYNADNLNVKWKSDNPQIVSVDDSGNVKALGVGSAIITVTSEDGGFSATCKIISKKPPLKASASVGSSMTCTSSGCGKYLFVSINASGGSGKYTYTYKLYKGTALIGQFNEKETYFTWRSGSYKVEYTVVDSDGDSVSGQSTYTIN